MNDKPIYKVVEASEIKPGPIQRTKLTFEFMNRAWLTWRALEENIRMTFADFIENFLRDVNCEGELAVWEHIAAAYSLELTRSNLDARQRSSLFLDSLNSSILTSAIFNEMKDTPTPVERLYHVELDEFYNSTLHAIRDKLLQKTE